MSKANSNYHTITEKNVFSIKMNDPKFAEYRRKWTENPRDYIVNSFPLHLDIESTNVCNLRCPYCATTSDMWGKSSKGYMDFALFKKIIDEGAAGGLYSIKCSFRGEPMLHQSLSDMVAYAKKKGIMDVYFNTNGTMFTDKNIRSLIEAGLDRISISIDGWDKASFERNRVGAKYEKVIEGILLLKRIREEMDSPFPQIRVQAVMLPDVKAHWAEYISFWKGMVDEIGYLDAREEGPQYDHRGQTGDFACPFLWQRMTILWDGTVMPCLMHGVEDFSLMKLGNVQETSIKELWHSQKLAGVRRLHQNFQSQKLEACDRCSYRASELKKVAISASATA